MSPSKNPAGGRYHSDVHYRSAKLYHHANDTFVQVSGYTLQELQGHRTTWCVTRICQKRRLRICGYPEKRGALERHREKSPQKWRHYWVRANAVPMVREGKISG